MRFLRNNTFFKFVMSFVILVCITIGTLGVFAYYSSKKIVMQRFAYQQQELLNHLSAGIQDKIALINEVTLLVSMDSRVSKAYFYSKDSRIEDIQNYREITGYLKGLSSSIDNLISISVHYNAADVVVSHDGKYNAEMFYNIVDYEGMGVNEWKQLLGEYKNFSLIHSGAVNIGGMKERTLTFGRTLPYDNTEHAYAFMAITVAEDFFNRLISPDVIKQNGNVTIVKDGKIILTTAKNMSAEAKERFKQYSDGDEICFDGKKCMVSTVMDNFNGWQYISTIPVDEVTRSINSFKLTIVALIIMVLLLGLALSLFFAKRLYTPISEIVHNVSGFSDDAGKKGTDDFKLIRLGISSIIAEKDSLVNELEITNSLLRTKVISDIINGRKEVFVTKDDWAGLGITFPFKRFQVIIMHENASQNNIDAVINDVIKHSRDWLRVYAITKDSYYIILCNYNAESEIDTKVYEFAKMLADTAHGEVIAVGKTCFAVNDVVQSYVEAFYALKYSGVSSGIVSAEDAVHTENMQKGYSIEDEQKLIWAVKTGDLQMTDSILEEFTKVNNPVIYSALMMTAYKIAVSYSLDKNDADYNLLMLSSEDPEIIKDNVIQHYHRLIEHFSKSAVERYNDIFLKIKERIDRDYTHEISLQQLGDEFGYSVPYLSFIFKEIAKVNYLDYVNNLRIELAKDLLLKTDLPLIDIAVKVGYNNTVTLNRVFKKLIGTTPGKYRENNM